jgi:hypothetical protein
MIRIELLREKKCELVPIGLSTLETENFLYLKDLDTTPRMINGWAVYMGRYEGKRRTATHIGYFPEYENRGIITRLVKPLDLRSGDYVSFIPGSISFILGLCGEEHRTISK